MMRELRGIARLIAFGLAIAGCASALGPRPTTAARMPDAAPEKVAAQRSAARGLDLEREDERWGFDAARERRRANDQKKTQSTEGRR